MKLLISTYACAPHHGSEHGVGWNWTTEACRQGHAVWALASPVNRDAILAACQADPALAGIHWIFPEVPGWRLRQGQEPRWERSYNLLWQLAALRAARALVRDQAFDLVHHLTWGGVRAPTFLGHLGVPLVIGPLGGGESSPPSLRAGLGLRGRITETIRELSNLTIRLNPVVRDGLTRASLILVRTADTARLLTPSMRAKSIRFSEISLPEGAIGQPRRASPGAPKLLFVGRLIYWKGAHIALRTLAELRRHIPGATLTIVGKGPELPRLSREAARLGVAGAVTFTPWLAREALTGVYDSHDLFLFPSLHDSSGTVVLEALARGLPVICTDSGGPAVIAGPQSGIAVRAGGRDTKAFATAMADATAELWNDPARYEAASAAAVARARQFILRDRVAQFFEQVAGISRAGGVAPAPPSRVSDTVFATATQ
jgi:glycosyltransferase involved in cell wall biosynthesis